MELKDICQYISEKVATTTLTKENYISTENMLPDKGGIVTASGVPFGNSTAFSVGDVLVSNIRPYFKKIWQTNRNGGCSADVLCFRANSNVDNSYFYYLLSQQEFFDYIMSGAKGCKMPRGDKRQIMQWKVELPPLDEQRHIASVLLSLDEKIELNRRINGNLEQQAQTLFNHYFIERPDLLGKYKISNLTGIANYLNGLAMQKFRPQIEENGIPVLKIKELGQGYTDASSDICSENIADGYKVHNGDVIFSWSGTLMVKIWCGGLCGLNQHLFKVSSEIYPKWFYYFWTKHHLNKFIRIAQDKAVTMGHIKRNDLEASEILIPQMDILAKLDAIISPLFSQIIEMKCENRNLAAIRDILLPQLMSGKLKINDLNR